ncbi:MAG: transposase family protein [Candidatus Competibacteraceae bacterium]|nr:transposase family protein [Candidatus Competibacteraceae bacterium]
MSTQTRRELLRNLRQAYFAAGRKKRQELLDSLVTATGYNRKYAISLLNRQPADPPRRRKRQKIYDAEVFEALKQVWIAANCICPKRLIPFLPSLLESMERFGHLKLEKKVRAKLLSVSASTADRLLRAERKRTGLGRSLTRPGSLLRKQVPIKIFTKWDDQEIGFFEIDLVAHCGDTSSGRFVNTLTMTDVASGWTELAAIECKSEDLVRSALDDVVTALPFCVLGLDTDNGSEFLNYGMVSWCNARNITFTRSRAYRKNDQAHVEEKNGSIVRRLVGYDRFEGDSARSCLAELYRVARLYINFFQPSMKLISKTRDGAKVSKRYDTARTPVARLLDSSSIQEKMKKRLRREFTKMDPMALLADMAKLQTKLWTFAVGKNGDMQPRTAPVGVTEAVPQRAKRKKRFHKRPLDTRSAKIFETILSLPYGAPVEAKQFYDIGTIHFVNATLHTIWKRDRIIARPAFGKYVRINPNDADNVENIVGKKTKK